MKIEIRSGGAVHISGYVNAVERDSRVLPARMAAGASGSFVERVAAGAFAKAISRGRDIRMMFNHSRDIGGTADGSLKLSEDNIGLHAEAEITDPEVRAAAEKGLLRGWSFGMKNPAAQWTDAGNGIQRRTIEDMELVEVSILTKTPAYFGTSVEMRSAEVSAAPVEVERRAFDDTAEVISTTETTEKAPEQRNYSQEINGYRKEIAALMALSCGTGGKHG